MSMQRVKGYCPMGCGQTLFLAEGDYVTCSYIPCPNPMAVSDILEDRESEHKVRFDSETFTVRHPTRERVGDQMLTCELHFWIADLVGPPVKPGVYRAVPRANGGWSFTEVAES